MRYVEPEDSGDHHRRRGRDDRRVERVNRDYRRRDERVRGNWKRSGYQRIQPAPDHVVNPSKWTRYDLSEDGTEGLKRSGMSDDQVNKFAAFQFLKDMRERKKREQAGAKEVEGGEGEKRVMFRNPVKAKETSSESRGEGRGRDGAISTGGGGAGAGVIKMAEYVVGSGVEQRVGRAGRRLRKRQLQVTSEEEGAGTEPVKKASSCISLSHLEELDDV